MSIKIHSSITHVTPHCQYKSRRHALGRGTWKAIFFILAQIAFTREKTVQFDWSFSKRGAALPQKA